MLEHYFSKPATVDRIRASWLAPEIERYVAWMHARGYARRSVERRVPVLCAFAGFARERGATDARTALGAVDGFVASRLARRGGLDSQPERQAAYATAVRSPIGQMLRLATDGQVSTTRKARPFPFLAEAPGFLKHLEEERGARPGTVAHHAHGLRRFAGYLAGVQAEPAHASPALLAAFVIDIAPGLSASSCSNICGALRVFLRYCHREGILGEDLAGAVEAPQHYRLSSLPRSISWDEVRRMLAAVDRRSAAGRRDYAMLLLLVTYGLRAGEVASLTLDDIDWRHDRLHVGERKAGNATAYPLAGPVAQALVDYIRDGRPATDDRHVFFRAIAPRSPIGPQGVSGRARAYLQRAGVQRLVDAGFPFKTVSDYVGHRSTDSTATYARIDIETLRTVALGDGEEL